MIREAVKNINESGKIDDLKKLEKALPKVFKAEDYFDVKLGIMGRFGSRAFDVVEFLGEKAGILDKLEVSKGGYVKDQVWRSENGYGNYGTPRKEYMEEWENMSQENRINYNSEIDKDKFYKKASSLVTKSLGKAETAKRICHSYWSNAGSAYDRNMANNKALMSGLEQLWYDRSEIYAMTERATLRNENKLTLYNWVRDLYKPF